MTSDTVVSLYQHGAFFCAGIVTVYLLAHWATGSFAWLKEPQHAHYWAALVGALGVVAIPAAQGTTPNASMIVNAVITLIALAVPSGMFSAPAAAKSSTSESGSARLGVMIVLALLACLTPACLTKTQVKSGGSTAAVCGFGDFVKYIDDVRDALAKDGWEQAIVDTAKKDNIAQEALLCLVQAVVAAYTPTPSATPATGQESPVFVHGKAWLDAHGGGK